MNIDGFVSVYHMKGDRKLCLSGAWLTSPHPDSGTKPDSHPRVSQDASGVNQKPLLLFWISLIFPRPCLMHADSLAARSCGIALSSKCLWSCGSIVFPRSSLLHLSLKDSRGSFLLSSTQPAGSSCCFSPFFPPRPLSGACSHIL